MQRNILLALLAPLMVSIFLTACNRTPDTSPQSAPKSWNLSVIKASTGVPVEYTTVGSVVSDQRVNIASRLSGYILEILVREGDSVRSGQLLVRIDASDVEGGIRQGKAAISAAEAAFHDAQTDLERFQRLFEHESISDYEMRKIRLKYDAARENLNLAQAVLDTARAQRDYAKIKSPIDGVVVARIKRAGDLAMPGTPILTLESENKLLLDTFVAEKQVASIAIGEPVEVRIDGLSSSLQGAVKRVVPSANPVTRSYQVKIALPETKGLMPGMFGRAVFQVGESKLPVVPKRALVERGGLRGVFIIDREGKAQFRWLRIGREWPERVEVTAGLQAGERFIEIAEPALRDGDLITEAEIDND